MHDSGDEHVVGDEQALLIHLDAFLFTRKLTFG